MPYRNTRSPNYRLIWYVASTLNMAGGGERVIMEGLKHFNTQGLEATLLLNGSMPNQAALFDDTYSPKVSIIGGVEKQESDVPLTWWQKIVCRLRITPRLTASISSLGPDVIIANDLESCRELWLSNLFSLRKLPAYVTFVHGSPFQFADDLTKYALIFRRQFAEIRKGDPVYREIIPTKLPPITLPKRIKLEIDCYLKYLALRRSQCVFVISDKNRREIELLYGHRNVVTIPAGGFSMADLTYQRTQDMKAANGLINQLVILSICRLVPKKRVDLAIRAFAELIRDHQHDDCFMVIGGTGPHESTLRSLAKELQIEDKIRFIGQVPESQLRDWYCSCDAFISTDNADYDLSVMMALPLGCKVVISTQYSLPMELDKVRRFIFIAEPSIQGLSHALDEAICTPVSTLSAAELKELEFLTWEHYFGTVLSLAERAVKNRLHQQ